MAEKKKKIAPQAKKNKILILSLMFSFKNLAIIYKTGPLWEIFRPLSGPSLPVLFSHLVPKYEHENTRTRTPKNTRNTRIRERDTRRDPPLLRTYFIFADVKMISEKIMQGCVEMIPRC